MLFLWLNKNIVVKSSWGKQVFADTDTFGELISVISLQVTNIQNCKIYFYNWRFEAYQRKTRAEEHKYANL